MRARWEPGDLGSPHPGVRLNGRLTSALSPAGGEGAAAGLRAEWGMDGADRRVCGLSVMRHVLGL